MQGAVGLLCREEGFHLRQVEHHLGRCFGKRRIHKDKLNTVDDEFLTGLRNQFGWRNQCDLAG